jgi:hypothetical protein
LATTIVNNKRKHNKLIDRFPVDGGVLRIGDEHKLNLPTKVEDGLYPVYLSADGCKITIDITPFPDGFEPIEYSFMEWKKEVVKMRRRKVEAESH